ncbi:MAG: MBOAT family O-acyltransferase [Thermodesulfobacteriota bacterium]
MLNSSFNALNYFILFTVLYYSSGLIIKSFILLFSDVRTKKQFSFYFLSPFYSNKLWNLAILHKSCSKIVNKDTVQKIGSIGSLYLLFCFLYLKTDLKQYCYSLLAFFLFYSFTELMSILFGIIYSKFRIFLPTVHNNPFRAKNLSDFWGNRWNIWVSTWLSQIVFKPLKRNPKLAVMTTFIVSGLWHEVIINIPHLILTGEKVFGFVTLYFIIQGLGVLISRRGFFRNRYMLSVIYLWIVVILPIPLIMNDAFMNIFVLR